MEIEMLGRKGQASPVIGMRKINGKCKWNSFAWLGVLAAYFILTYYIQIMGWIVNYLFQNIKEPAASPLMRLLQPLQA